MQDHNCYICKTELTNDEAIYTSFEGTSENNRKYYTFCGECNSFVIRWIELLMMNAALELAKRKNDIIDEDTGIHDIIKSCKKDHHTKGAGSWYGADELAGANFKTSKNTTVETGIITPRKIKPVPEKSKNNSTQCTCNTHKNENEKCQ